MFLFAQTRRNQKRRLIYADSAGAHGTVEDVQDGVCAAGKAGFEALIFRRATRQERSGVMFEGGVAYDSRKLNQKCDEVFIQDGVLVPGKRPHGPVYETLGSGRRGRLAWGSL